MAKKKKNEVDAIEMLNKKYGGILHRWNEKVQKIDVISTGILSLDIALGVGGLPLGRVVEIYGPESSGKTTLCLQIMKQSKKKVCFIDAEHSLDVEWAKKIGVDMEKIVIAQPDSGEEALQLASDAVETEAFDIIVVDSVAALTPRAEIEGEMGDSHVGLVARLMSQAMRKLVGNLHKKSVTIIFVNQIREKIGVTYGSPEVTTGGRALRFYASIRIDVRRIATVKDSSGVPTGNMVKIKIVKNKVAPPYKECEVKINFDSGFDVVEDIISLAVKKGLITRSGSWYSYNGEAVGQGLESVKKWARETGMLQKLKEEIENDWKQRVGIGT